MSSVLAALASYSSLRDITIQQISTFISLSTCLKNDIQLPQPVTISHEGPPLVLPPTIAEFLAESISVTVSTVNLMWDVLKEEVWRAPLKKVPTSADEEYFREYGWKRELTSITLYPPSMMCINSVCPRTSPIKKAEFRQVVVYTVDRGACRAWCVHLFCPDCSTNYHHNYFVQNGQRYYYPDEMPMYLQVSEHQFVEDKLAELWISLMLLGWMSAGNCLEAYDRSLSQRDRSDVEPEGWRFSLQLTNEHVWDTFVIWTLLSQHRRRNVILIVPHTGSQKDRFTELMQQVINEGQDEIAHYCNKCIRVWEDEHGNLRKCQVVVTDGVALGHPCCAEFRCTVPLANNRHRFCPIHFDNHKICAVKDCTEPAVAGRKSCRTKGPEELLHHACHLPPTPSDSAARWPREVDEAPLPVPSGSMPEIPDFLEESNTEDWEKIQRADYTDEDDLPAAYKKVESNTPPDDLQNWDMMESQIISPPPLNDENNAHDHDNNNNNTTNDNNDEYPEASTSAAAANRQSQPPNPWSRGFAALALELEAARLKELEEEAEREREKREKEEKEKEKERIAAEEAKRAEEERKRKEEEEEKRIHEEMEALQRKKEEEEAAQREKEEKERKKKRKKKAEEKAERAKKEAEDEAEAARLKEDEEKKKKAEEEEAKRKAEEEEEKKRIEEEAEAKRLEELERQKAEEAQLEAERKAREDQLERERIEQEEEQQRRQAAESEEALKKAQEEEVNGGRDQAVKSPGDGISPEDQAAEAAAEGRKTHIPKDPQPDLPAETEPEQLVDVGPDVDADAHGEDEHVDQAGQVDLFSDAESVITEASEVPSKVKERLQKILLTKAQIFETEARLEELKGQLETQDDANKANVEENIRAMENVLRKCHRKEDRRASEIPEPTFLGPKFKGDSEDTIMCDRTLGLGNVETKIEEKLESMLQPGVRSLQLMVKVPTGQPAKKVMQNVTKTLTKYHLLDYVVPDKNSSRNSQINISEKDFGHWLASYRQSVTKAEEDEEGGIWS